VSPLDDALATFSPLSNDPIIAVSVTGFPSRHTSTATFVPGAMLPMRLVTSVLSVTATLSMTPAK
jgi:hypothetical protein